MDVLAVNSCVSVTCQSNPDFVCVGPFLLSDKNPQQHVPLQEYSDNLKDIAQYLTSIGVPKDKVVFITPPPLHDADWEKQCILKGPHMQISQ